MRKINTSTHLNNPMHDEGGGITVASVMHELKGIDLSLKELYEEIESGEDFVVPHEQCVDGELPPNTLSAVLSNSAEVTAQTRGQRVAVLKQRQDLLFKLLNKLVPDKKQVESITTPKDNLDGVSDGELISIINDESDRGGVELLFHNENTVG